MSSHLTKDSGVEEEGPEKEDMSLSQLVQKLFHLVGAYMKDLVGQLSGVTSCQEWFGVSGHVAN